MWLDFAEDQALRRKDVFLRDWEKKLDAFLRFNERAVLSETGRVSNKDAVTHTEGRYEQFVAERRASLEAEGEAYAARVLQAPSADELGLKGIGEMVRQVIKNEGKTDAA